MDWIANAIALLFHRWCARLPSSNEAFGLPEPTNLVSLVTPSRGDAAFGRGESPRFVGPGPRPPARAGGMEAAP